MVDSSSTPTVIISHQPKKSLARQPGLPPASSRAQQPAQKWFILQQWCWRAGSHIPSWSGGWPPRSPGTCAHGQELYSCCLQEEYKWGFWEMLTTGLSLWRQCFLDGLSTADNSNILMLRNTSSSIINPMLLCKIEWWREMKLGHCCCCRIVSGVGGTFSQKLVSCKDPNPQLWQASQTHHKMQPGHVHFHNTGDFPRIQGDSAMERQWFWSETSLRVSCVLSDEPLCLLRLPLEYKVNQWVRTYPWTQKIIFWEMRVHFQDKRDN